MEGLEKKGRELCIFIITQAVVNNIDMDARTDRQAIYQILQDEWQCIEPTGWFKHDIA